MRRVIYGNWKQLPIRQSSCYWAIWRCWDGQVMKSDPRCSKIEVWNHVMKKHMITIKTEITKTTSVYQKHQCINKISSISAPAALAHQHYQGISTIRALAHQQHQQHQRLSSISASTASAHQQHKQHQRISSISTSAASAHQSISASAASAYKQHQRIRA